MKPPLWATVLTLCGFLVLCALGIWQVQRLQWKTEILQALQTAETISAAPDLSHEDIATLAANPDDLALIRYVFVHGRWRHDKEIAVGPRTWQGKPGFHIITPLQLEGGGTVLVNRGWVPLDKKLSASRPESLVPADQGLAMGLLRRPESPSVFTPANNPASEEWYRINPAQMAKARGLEDVAPLVLYARLDGGSASLPVKDALHWRPNNNHLGYALFWFTMAALLLVIFYLRFIRKP